MKPTILVADDDHGFVSILMQLLQSEGFDVVTAHEGIRAIESAHKHKVNLILLDLKMPVGSGQSVLESLRSRPETQDIPIIVLTGADDPNIEEVLKAKGAQAYLKKPFQKDILLQKIREFMKPV